MNILVTGSKGQLGRELQHLAPSYDGHRFVFTDKEELDITVAGPLISYFRENEVDCVINCAGYTAVDAAEDDLREAKRLNTNAVGYLADAAAEVDALMVHVSTDYVFNGQLYRPYIESDVARPCSVYGKTKLEGEVEVLFRSTRSVIIRTSWLYSSYGHNFVKTILKKAAAEGMLHVVNDQVGTPTYAADLAKAIMDMLPLLPEKICGEIYNYSNEGVCSWYDFAIAIIEEAGLNCPVSPVPGKTLKTAAVRPPYSVLNKTKIRSAYNLKIPHWRDGLRRCLEKINI